jgi:cytochrome c
MTSRFLYSLFLMISVALTGCGGGGSDAGSSSSGSASADQSGLSANQLEHGIGPISAFELGEINPDMAAKGGEVFLIKCSACHKLETRYIGPELGTVLDRRSPAYVMNMILNPEQMVTEHPEARAMLAEYMTPMANQNLTEEEARSIVEYIRSEQAAN